MKTPTSRKSWRLRIGVGILIAAFSLPLGGVALSVLGWRGLQSALVAFLLAGGLPEILCLIAAAILGQEYFAAAARPARLFAHASRLRYYAGLMGCLLNGVPIWLYAYVPWLLPDGSSRFFILVAADLVFFFSLFLAGGEFWGKFRRLFVWEGSAA